MVELNVLYTQTHAPSVPILDNFVTCPRQSWVAYRCRHDIDIGMKSVSGAAKRPWTHPASMVAVCR